MQEEFSDGEDMLADLHGWEDLEALDFSFHGNLRESPRPRVVGADGSFEDLCGLREIQSAILSEELRCVGDSVGILGSPGLRIFRKDFQCLGKGSWAEIGEAVVEFSCGFLGSDIDGLCRNDVPGIQLPYHVHDGDTSFRIPVRDGGLDTGRASVFRKDGGVEVNDRLHRSLADGFPYDLPVGHHDNEVWNQISEFLGDFPDLLRLPDRNVMGERDGLDLRWNRAALAAPDRLVGLGNEKARFRAVLNQMAEGWERDVSGGDEGDFQDGYWRTNI